MAHEPAIWGLYEADPGDPGPARIWELRGGGVIGIHYEDDVSWVPWPDDDAKWYLPDRFRAIFGLPDVPYEVELALRILDRRLITSAMTLHRVKARHRFMQTPRMAEPRHDIVGYDVNELSSEGLRKVPVARLERLAAVCALHSAPSPEGRRGAPPSLDEWDVLFASHGQQQRRRNLDDDHYRKVADVYRRAWEADYPPRRAVAGHFTVSDPTAARWVSEARSRGFLGRTRKGQAGPGSDQRARTHRGRKK